MSDFSVFANRLRKNQRHWAKWAKRRAISCYRVYDRDVPAFPLAIDVYETRVHVQEFDTGWQETEAQHAVWMEQVCHVVAEVMALPRSSVAYKLRARQRGLAQYEKTGATGEDFVVSENGHRFIVNLDDYLDTGLFLDHRNTRRLVQDKAAGKRVLNLFAYTGSFTVYAAAGGAMHSVTVDLSNTYQDWTRRNFELNGVDLNRHQLMRADVLPYLTQALAKGAQFDLIVMDPPSFSNSKKMDGVLDVQRDHSGLINQCLGLLSLNGELVFSSNLRSFQLEQNKIARCQIQEISPQTVPDDYRNKKIHRCWILKP